MKNITETIAENMKELRTMHKLTQGEVADALGVSDKTISKWELGGSTPSIEYLAKIADLYGVTVDQIIKETKFELIDEGKPVTDDKRRTQQILVLSLVPVVFLFVAICIWIGNYMINSDNKFNLWISFIWMIPLSCLFMAVLVNHWWKNCTTLIVLASIFIWTSLLSFCLQFQFYPPYKPLWFILIIGIPLQIAVIILSKIKKV